MTYSQDDKRKFLILACRFYNGNDTCVYEEKLNAHKVDKSHLPYPECMKDEFTLPYEEVCRLEYACKVMFYEKCWVEDQLNGYDDSRRIQEYVNYGNKDFEADDCTPISLKALLWERYYHMGGWMPDQESFRNWYREYYAWEPTNREKRANKRKPEHANLQIENGKKLRKPISGDCPGTCPKCDAELAGLQRQLEEKGITDITQDEALSKMVAEFLSPVSQDSVADDEEMIYEGIVPDTVADTPIESMPMSLEGDIMLPDEMPKFQRRMILECPVAGIGFHDINDIWDELYVGAKIALVRERNNKYDRNAVAVALANDYDGNPDDFDFDFILGYIPRKDNQAIAAMLDMGWQDLIEAEISEMNDHAPYNDRLHIAIYIRSKEPEKPKDSRLRLKTFQDEEEWKGFTDELWEKGVSFFREF